MTINYKNIGLFFLVACLVFLIPFFTEDR